MDNRRFLPFIIIGVVAFIIILSAFNRIFYRIEAYERAVLFKTLTGTLEKENIIGPGWHFKAPWNEIYIYEVSENKIEETMDVLDKNGLNISVDVTVRFHPQYDQIGEIQESFRGDFIQRLVIPEARSTVRQVMGRYTAEEIYSTKRPEVEAAIKEETRVILGGDGVEMKSLLIRSIKLPDQIKNAIENKLKQEQEALAYQFRLDKEISEAERKRIAAEGEAAANQIINSSLTPELLKMRGIEATKELASSPNSKVIVVGGGDSGLPLILNGN